MTLYHGNLHTQDTGHRALSLPLLLLLPWCALVDACRGSRKRDDESSEISAGERRSGSIPPSPCRSRSIIVAVVLARSSPGIHLDARATAGNRARDGAFLSWHLSIFTHIRRGSGLHSPTTQPRLDLQCLWPFVTFYI
jgi:hypothetical protein